MNRFVTVTSCLALGVGLCVQSPATAQQDDMAGMAMPPTAPADRTQSKTSPTPVLPPQPASVTAAPPKPPSTPAGDAMPGMDMPGTAMSNPASGEVYFADMRMMPAALGAGSMMREASGTSWQPSATPMDAITRQAGGWWVMLHGDIFGVYDHQGGSRGASKTFSESMLMVMAEHSLGRGRLTLRTMVSLDPAMGKDGYPLLLQTGETANGATPLIDRQHPHDLFMELAGVYSLPVGPGRSAFLYVGYPGEPALGPPAFMHRASGMDNPAAPISHHWLDSTHITYGVVTSGVIAGPWKIEGSVFNGREPDQYRWNFDRFRLDSFSGRISFNPTANWSVQVSHGFIKGPEQLEPGVNQHRTTASASYDRPLANGNWQTTLAWGRNVLAPGPTLDAFLLESTVTWKQHTLFARAENAQKNELFLAPNPLAGRIFRVYTASLGYIYDIPVARHLAFGIGAMAGVYALPDAIKGAYGDRPVSTMVFLRVKTR